MQWKKQFATILLRINNFADQQHFNESEAMQQWTSSKVTEVALRKVWWFHEYLRRPYL